MKIFANDAVLILALDPGQLTGYAYLDLSDGRLTLKAAGLVVPPAPGKPALLAKLRGWVDGAHRRTRFDDLAWEGPVNAHGLATNNEAHEARAVLRLWAMDHMGGRWAEYGPSTVASRATVLNPDGERKGKKCVRAGVLRMVDVSHVPQYLDHIPDAVAVGICHAMEAHGWRPEGARRTRATRNMDPLIERLHERVARAKGGG